jgi:hypothetical protein
MQIKEDGSKGGLYMQAGLQVPYCCQPATYVNMVNAVSRGLWDLGGLMRKEIIVSKRLPQYVVVLCVAGAHLIVTSRHSSLSRM